MNLLDPQGPVAAANSTILVDSVFIMLAIVVPTIIAILAFAFWFRASNPKAKFQPDFVYSGRVEMAVWRVGCAGAGRRARRGAAGCPAAPGRAGPRSGGGGAAVRGGRRVGAVRG